MEYKKGDRVKHPIKEDWGIGEVLQDGNSESVRVFFVGCGEKTLSLQYVQPTKINREESNNPILDNLKLSKSVSGVKYQSLPHSIQHFLMQFPEGFYGEKFNFHERTYKIKAHTLAKELLAVQLFRELLNREEYAEICKHTLKVSNATQLIFPNEKMALKDGLKSLSAQKAFAQALFTLLYGDEDLEKRFDGLAKVLDEIGAAKWTVATYFLFIVHPDKYMFVKPTIMQYASDLCGFEINYKPQLNWLTYNLVLRFSNYLMSEISELKPRDMIDVQSFMWCITPGTYQVE